MEFQTLLDSANKSVQSAFYHIEFPHYKKASKTYSLWHSVVLCELCVEKNVAK